MTKPDILTGQAVPYLQWFVSTAFSSRVHPNLRWPVAEFYAQPFTPDLIPKLFKGWEVMGVHAIEILGPNEEVMDFYAKQGGLLIIQCDDLSTARSKPRNLDDFISDCTRAGIKLFWRE